MTFIKAMALTWYLYTLAPPGMLDADKTPNVVVWQMRDELACRIAKDIKQGIFCFEGTEPEAAALGQALYEAFKDGPLSRGKKI